MSTDSNREDYWTHQFGTAETRPKNQLNTQTIEGVEPLDSQLGTVSVKAVPDVLFEPLFGPLEPTQIELKQTDGDPAKMRVLQTYAILDAAKIAGLSELLATSGLEHRCLFKGGAYETLRDVAPWIVRLEPDHKFIRNLFTRSDAYWHAWDAEPGIFLRSRGALDELWKHFRKFTKVQGDDGKWFYFRFWEPFILYGLAENGTQLASHICTPLHSVLAPLDTYTIGQILNPTPTAGRPKPPVLSMRTKSVLSNIRQRQMLVEMAQKILLGEPAATTLHDWPCQRDQMVRWGIQALQTYGLAKYKSLHSYLMIRHAAPEIFDDNALKINEILLAPNPETSKLEALIKYLRTV